MREEIGFVPAKIRREFRRGKRSDREALFRHTYYTMLNGFWSDAMTREHPFITRLKRSTREELTGKTIA